MQCRRLARFVGTGAATLGSPPVARAQTESKLRISRKHATADPPYVAAHAMHYVQEVIKQAQDLLDPPIGTAMSLVEGKVSESICAPDHL
jgi:hypothetical protein